MRGEPARTRRAWYHRVLNIACSRNEPLPADWIVDALDDERLEYADQQRRRYAQQRRIEWRYL
jgi:hypothetical protein